MTVARWRRLATIFIQPLKVSYNVLFSALAPAAAGAGVVVSAATKKNSEDHQ
jgi:hypothetical protein